MEHLPPMQTETERPRIPERQDAEGRGEGVGAAGRKVRRFPRAISRAEAERAIKDAGGNKRLAARQLGISRTSLYKLLG